MHFVPKMLKIGRRTIQYVTIKGVIVKHSINVSAYYELFYDNYTGDASVSGSGFGDNPNGCGNGRGGERGGDDVSEGRSIHFQV